MGYKIGFNANIVFAVAFMMIVSTGLGGCTKRPAINTTDTTEAIETEKEPVKEPVKEVKPAKNVVVKERKPGPKTWENAGGKIAKNDVVKFKKPIPAKPTPAGKFNKIAKADRKWETGASKDYAPKADMSTADSGSRGRPERLAPASSAMAKAGPSLSGVGGAGSSFGLGSGGASGKLGRATSRPLAEAKKSIRPREDRTYQSHVGDNILTAGSFDDADDIQMFQKFWNQSELSRSTNINLRDVDWARTFKKADTRRHASLQLAFVVDTTGSMGDELEYLKKEFKSIVSEINRSFPGVRKEYAFIVYRDQHDEYVTRGLNFTSDVDAVQSFMREQSANGGGDYPEAVHTALEEAYSRLDWNDDSSSARMLFHIADAPAHMHEMNNTFEAVEKLSSAGVNVFPVAASGVQDLAEAMMRATALLTGGQYIFLTDDSGVGLAHAAPKHPCYEVEKLKTIMVRVIKDRISGSRTFPIAKNIIRHGGDRTTGYCRIHKNVVGQW